ncbi:MAG: DUF92 domain-containing protein [Acidobacteriota bacterium]|nr:DUF92 domain-containing protein [Acidobacteriota bacterium]
MDESTTDKFNAATMPAKAIPPARDRLQSRLLVWTVMPLLFVLDAVRSVALMVHAPRLHTVVFESVGFSTCLALLAWRLKAATLPAALSGGVICLSLLYGTQAYRTPLTHSALIPLVELFVLTFLATRAGRNRKTATGLAESRLGRTTSQVVANLGFAALLAVPLTLIAVCVWRVWPRPFIGLLWPQPTAQSISLMINIGVIAALAEATADTVSSEIGQAFGLTPILLTTLRPVPPGTDGAISFNGTLAGIAAAVIIAATGAPTLGLDAHQCILALTAAVAGLFFDTLLGATLERRGFIGNDLVNFASTAFSAAVAIALGVQALTTYTNR